MKKILIMPALIMSLSIFAQDASQDSVKVYKKRVLETIEIDFLASYYSQEGRNAAVSGGKGNEELTDFTPTIVVAIPLNDDDVLSIDFGVSAYTSASSSNVDPFDGTNEANPFVASSGASSQDALKNLTGVYSHSSDNRNTIWTSRLSLAIEYDYASIGFGGSYTKLFNEKNTEFTVNGNIYLDSWTTIYPSELRSFSDGGSGLNSGLFRSHTITGSTIYNPIFNDFASTSRNSYSLGLGFSQILSKNLQGSLVLDFVIQDGLLATPFQRVYFQDVADSFIENFQLADANELLPGSRFKVALGGRMNYYINEIFVLKTHYRYYQDDWGIGSHTASIELPIKISSKFTLYPEYRYYNQGAADYFAGFEQHLSTDEFYTSDYDLSKFSADQFGFGVSYTDIFTSFNIGKYALKSIDMKYNVYERNTGLKANIFSFGVKFVVE